MCWKAIMTKAKSAIRGNDVHTDVQALELLIARNRGRQNSVISGIRHGYVKLMKISI